MPENPTFDPVAAWQEFVGRWERQVNDMSAAVSGNEMFAGPMNHAAKLSFATQKSFADTMEKLAVSMQLATQPQMLDVIERLDRIEQQLDRIAARIAPPTVAIQAPEPRRTRRPATSST